MEAPGGQGEEAAAGAEEEKLVHIRGWQTSADVDTAPAADLPPPTMNLLSKKSLAALTGSVRRAYFEPEANLDKFKICGADAALGQSTCEILNKGSRRNWKAQ